MAPTGPHVTGARCGTDRAPCDRSSLWHRQGPSSDESVAEVDTSSRADLTAAAVKPPTPLEPPAPEDEGAVGFFQAIRIPVWRAGTVRGRLEPCGSVGQVGTVW